MYGYGYQYSKISGGLSPAQILAAAYKARVEADGGTYENGSCLTTFLNSLNPYSGNLLLGLYPNAAAAYSLRLLNPDYTGDAIRVRRSSDNAEQDIGFVSGVLDTASLLTFCGAGSGYITTWYDQSGNARNATQSTAANQPKIYDGTTGVVLSGSLPAMTYDGTNDYLTAAFTSLGTVYTSFLVANVTAGAALPYYIYTLAATTNNSYRWNGTSLFLRGSTDISYASGAVGRALHTNIQDTTSYMYLNTVQKATGASGSATFTNVNIGGSGSTFAALVAQEMIVYASNQSANRLGIAANINSYYGIY